MENAGVEILRKLAFIGVLLLVVIVFWRREEIENWGAGAIYPVGVGVVFTGSSALQVLQQCSRGSVLPVDDVWSPNDSDIKKLEIQLNRYLNTHRNEAEFKNLPLKKYLHQYVGFIKGGRKMIYVNAFQDGNSSISGWRDYPVSVCDGGNGYFGVTYDTANGRISDFEFNGLA